jgi:hypothetical protein
MTIRDRKELYEKGWIIPRSKKHASLRPHPFDSTEDLTASRQSLDQGQDEESRDGGFVSVLPSLGPVSSPTKDYYVFTTVWCFCSCEQAQT